MVQFSIINFVCDNYLLLVMNYGNRNPYQIISFMIFQCSSELDLFWKIIKNGTNFRWKQKKILLKACLENEFWISYFITKPSELLLYTIYSIYQKAQLFKKSISHKFQIIPEPVLKNTQLVTEEISEDMASAKEELDQAVPFHTLLDVSGNFDLNQ